jgi:hypothetical protein
LLAPGPPRSFYFVSHDLVLAEENDRTLVTDPVSGSPRLFERGRDWLQRRPLTANPADLDELVGRARDAARLNDYLLRNNRIWPASGS